MKYIYDYIYTIPLSILLAILLGDSNPSNMQLTIAIVASFAVAVVLVLLKNVRRKIQIIASGILIIVLGSLLAIFFQTLVSHYHWVLVAVGSGVIAFILAQLIIKYRFLRVGFVAVAFSAMLVTMFMHYTINKLAVATILFLFAMVILEETENFWEKEKGKEKMPYVCTIAPFIIVVIVCISLIKVPAKPYDWHHFIEAWNKTVEFVVDTKDRIQWQFAEDLDVREVGVAEEATLAGMIKANPKKVMTVTPSFGLSDHLYLVGNLFNDFDGKEWKNTVTNNSDTRSDDAKSILDTLVKKGYPYTDDYVKSNHVKILYSSAKSHFAFVPEKSVIDTYFLRNHKIQFEGDNLVFPNQNKYKESFELGYYEVNYGNKIFSELVAELIEENQKLPEEISENYIREVEMSPELRAYMDEIYKDCTNDYEKMLSLEKMLRKLEYTTKPGNLPESVDTASEFLDYFILENKKGYCSYFATAFTLLAQAEGLPVRYVQGYCVPLDGTNTVNVKSSMAHAWAQVYFEGCGWLSFEPTPGYDNKCSWLTRAEVEDRKKQQASYYSKYQTAGDLATSEVPDLVEKEEEKPRQSVKPEQVLASLAILLLFIIIAVIVCIILKKNQYKKLNEIEKEKAWCRKNLVLVSYITEPMKSGETISEYKQRISKYVGPANLDFVDKYEALLYSKKPSAIGLCEILDNNKRLIAVLKRTNKWKYLMYKIKTI